MMTQWTQEYSQAGDPCLMFRTEQAEVGIMVIRRYGQAAMNGYDIDICAWDYAADRGAACEYFQKEINIQKLKNKAMEVLRNAK